jgi:hypothetical protein
MKYIFTTISLLLFGAFYQSSTAQTPDWKNQVSCIVYSHCTSCHNPNGLAPFSLTTYQQAFTYRNSILQAVEDKHMPPYLPNTEYSHFGDEKVLTTKEIELIRDWVNAGAPEGTNTQPLPEPVYNSGEIITQPDQQLSIPNFTIPATGNDLYQSFVISNPTNTVKYIDSLEVIPGNRNIVHHVLIFQDTSYQIVANDSSFAGPGYVSFGGVGSSTAKLIATWVPGSNINSYPAGMGIRLEAGARIVVQIHYPVDAEGQSDQTRLNLSYSSTPLRNVNIAPVLNSGNLTNGPLVIPANTTRTFHAQYTVPVNITAVSVGPHAHLICRSFECFGITPVGDTLKFIKIDEWDFHWQGGHPFRRPIKIPAGTVLHSYAYYDNTDNNPENPSNPPQTVNQGEATTDEMMLIYFGFLTYQNGDEQLIIDTASHSAHYMNCELPVLPVDPIPDVIKIYPNPVQDWLFIQLPGNPIFTAKLIDATGKLIAIYKNQSPIYLKTLPAGVYYLQLLLNEKIITQKIIKSP